MSLYIPPSQGVRAVEASYELVPLAEMPPIAIGIACNKYQQTAPWRSLWTLRWNGGSIMTSSGALTDQNRNFIAGWFLQETSLEWLFFVDDDIELPAEALHHLYSAAVALDAKIMAGVYYRRTPPFFPLLFRLHETGWYQALLPDKDYRRGQILVVDGVGMGCTLIHRSVLEAILNGYFLYRRQNRSYGFAPYEHVIMHERMYDVTGNGTEAQQEAIRPGIHVFKNKAFAVTEVWPTTTERMEPTELLPFFALEYGRTEDFHFCELARGVGYSIHAHTGVECRHWGESPVDYATYEHYATFLRAQGQE